MESVTSRFKKAWNIFMNRDPTPVNYDIGIGSYRRPDRIRFSRVHERTIITAIMNRIAMDVAQIELRHVKCDENGRYESDVDSQLNQCLSLAANVDQTPRQFIQDVVMSMMDEGVVAIVPVDVDADSRTNEINDIYSLRVAKIVQWYPQHVKLHLYNDRIGEMADITMPKSMVAIVENPLYAIINDKNSALQRLIHKMNLLDSYDDQQASGKLDLIIQLPYVIKTDSRREQAEQRRRSIEDQLTGSKYGIAYTDGTEKIVQLNRPLENNLDSQVEYLTNLLFAQLGITQSILDGTADEQTMLNYNNRIIEPIISAIANGMKRSFISEASRNKGESILFFRDPFRLVPLNNIAEIVDKLTRNEIMTSNEIRGKIGLEPSKDPSADELRNKNLSAPKESIKAKAEMNEQPPDEKENQNDG